MSTKALYLQFMAKPSPASLTDHASLNYITTLTTINEPTSILKHFSREEKQLKKKEEKVLDAIESQHALFVEVATTIEFLTSGGSYLPGLDDNFVADRVVSFPITHVVHFDSSGKIQQIRLSWDQGALLKLVDVIGSRARTWPIRDGKDQARLIASSVASITNAAAKGSASQENLPADGARDRNETTKTSRGHSSSTGSKNVTRDPHASLALFAPREDDDDSSYPAAIPPRASAKPAPRDYHDLFVSNDSTYSETPKPSTGGHYPSETPIAHKGGAGKNFKPSRLFETDASQPGTPGTPQESPSKFYKTHPTKYDHFDFGDGSDETQRKPDPSAANLAKTKHQGHWDFEDSTKAEKGPTKLRGQDVRHFGFGDDDGAPIGDRRTGRPKGVGQNNGMGLYQMNLYDDDELRATAKNGEQQNKPLSNVTNTNNHRKYFESQFTLADQSPAAKAKVNDENKPLGENKQNAVKKMGSQWDAYDQSPGDGQGKKESAGRNPTSMGIKTGGDGMGGMKGASRNWGIGDDSDEEATRGYGREKFHAGKKQQAPADDSFWDY